MKVLAVHPGPLTYSKVFLRLEPLGLEIIAEAARQAGSEVRLVDLQVESHDDYRTALSEWRPDIVAFSCNYLPNVPEIVDLAKGTKRSMPGVFIVVGGHCASFVARDLIEHAAGAIDVVMRGEAEASLAELLACFRDGERALAAAPGAVSAAAEGPAPRLAESLDKVLPARDLLRRRRKYFIGMLDPCASMEFSRGCPWDCSFCSAWTFYGRSYRSRSTGSIVEELQRIREPGVFLVDDVAFIHAERGLEIGEAIRRRGIRKQYYLETRGDVLLRNREVFRYWKDVGLRYIFLGIEAINEENLRRFRKRTTSSKNLEALELARQLGIKVAINIIADPDWDPEQFKLVREWCLEVPEIVNLTINTPYPGTETWLTEPRKLTTLDYRLYDITHAVMPTKLPLRRFYEEYLGAYEVLKIKHMGWREMVRTAGVVFDTLRRGQTNYVKLLWQFSRFISIDRLMADHARHVDYAMRPPAPAAATVKRNSIYVHTPAASPRRALDPATSAFVASTSSNPPPVPPDAR